MKISDLTLSSILYNVVGCKIIKKHIKTFDLDQKRIHLYDSKDEGRKTHYDLFSFKTLDDFFLTQGSNSKNKVYFTREDARQGMIEAIKQQIREDEDDIKWKTEYIRKAKKRLELFELA